MLSIGRFTSIEPIKWSLPPSKSHAIRWITLAAQSQQEVVLRGMEHAGQDVVSMRRCLVQMGAKVEDLDGEDQTLTVSTNDDDQPANGSVAWKIFGVGPKGLRPPVSVLHAGNSGTSLRILMALVSLHDAPIMVDGELHCVHDRTRPCFPRSTNWVLLARKERMQKGCRSCSKGLLMRVRRFDLMWLHPVNPPRHGVWLLPVLILRWKFILRATLFLVVTQR